MSLLDRLISQIEAEGPMPFEDFMQASLYDPEDGFFASGPLRSVKAGDFLTSPEVSPWFGRTLGRFAAAERSVLQAGGAAPFTIVDVGAGSGSLLTSLIEELGDGATEVWAVDASPAARASLEQRSDWQVSTGLDHVPSRLTGVIVANELLDNLPVALVARHGDGWEERWVGLSSDGLALAPMIARPEIEEWAERFGGSVRDGGMIEVQIAAGEWLNRALSRLQAGAVLVVDYGGTAEELEPRRTQGTLRTYRAHHLGPDPLLEPGATDVTVDVNFSALQAVAADAGAEVELQRQDDFLSAWGLRDEVARMRGEELDLARGGDAMARLQVRSERTEAETLLHPRGLGDFRVLVARRG
jgi:SAM-dependent MidA family methyltransferase